MVKPKTRTASSLLSPYAEQDPLTSVKFIIGSCERTIARIVNGAKRLGLNKSGGYYVRDGIPYFRFEWDEAHVTLRRARTLYEAIIYDAALRANRSILEEITPIKERVRKAQYDKQQLSIQMQRKYTRLDGRWVGSTEEDTQAWASATAESEAAHAEFRIADKRPILEAAKAVIALYKRKLINGHPVFKGYVPDAVRSLVADDIEKRSGELASMAANKIGRDEILCRAGISAFASTYRRLVVGKLPSLGSARNQIHAILTLDPEHVKQIRADLSYAYHTGCKTPNCSFDELLRQLAEGIPRRASSCAPQRDDDGSTTCTSGGGGIITNADATIDINGEIGECGQTPCPKLCEWPEDLVPADPEKCPISDMDRHIDLSFEGEYNSESDSGGESRGCMSPSPQPCSENALSGICKFSWKTDDSTETSDNISIASSGDLFVPPASSLPKRVGRGIRAGTSSERAVNSAKVISTIHNTDTILDDSTKVQGGATVQSSSKVAKGVPISSESSQCGREIRCDDSSTGDIYAPVRRGENVDGYTGNKQVLIVEDEQLCDQRMVSDDTDTELVVQSTNLRQATLDSGTEQMPRRHVASENAETQKRMLDSITKFLPRMQEEASYETSYARHLGCKDTFRLLPQPTKESIRTSLGYYPSWCTHDVQQTPLRGSETGKVVGYMLSGKPGYSVIIISEEQTEILLEGAEVNLRATFGSERLRRSRVRKSRKVKRLDKGPSDDTVQKSKVQLDAGEIHKGDGKVIVPNERQFREQVDSQRNEQQAKGKTPSKPLEPGGRSSRTVTGLNKVGSALQHRIVKSFAQVLSDAVQRPRAENTVEMSVKKQRGHDARDKVHEHRWGNERRYDDSLRKLCISCYHCLNTVKWDERKLSWVTVEDGRRWGRFRGPGKQVLCRSCEDATYRRVQANRTHLESGRTHRRVSPNRVLPNKTTTTPWCSGDGAKSTQGVSKCVHSSRKEGSSRISQAVVGNESNFASRSTRTRTNFSKSKQEVSTNKIRADRTGVRGKSRRSHKNSVERCEQ